MSSISIITLLSSFVVASCTTHYVVDTQDLTRARADVRANPDEAVFIRATEVQFAEDASPPQRADVRYPVSVLNVDVRSLRGTEDASSPLTTLTFTSNTKPTLIASGAVLAVAGLAMTAVGAWALADEGCGEPPCMFDGLSQAIGLGLLIPGVLTVAGGVTMGVCGALIAPPSAQVPHYGGDRPPPGFGAGVQGSF